MTPLARRRCNGQTLVCLSLFGVHMDVFILLSRTFTVYRFHIHFLEPHVVIATVEYGRLTASKYNESFKRIAPLFISCGHHPRLSRFSFNHGGSITSPYTYVPGASRKAWKLRSIGQTVERYSTYLPQTLRKHPPGHRPIPFDSEI